MSYKVEWHDSLHICKFVGSTSGAEIMECHNILHGDSRFDDVRASVWDFSEVTDLDLTVEQCIRIAAQGYAAAKTNPKIKAAIVASLEIVETFANLYEAEMLSTPWETKTFQNIDEAMKWCS